MTPYDHIDMGQYWLRWWHVAWWHQTIIYTNVDSSSKVFCGIHLQAILQEMHRNIIHNMHSENTVSKLLPNL